MKAEVKDTFNRYFRNCLHHNDWAISYATLKSEGRKMCPNRSLSDLLQINIQLLSVLKSFSIPNYIASQGFFPSMNNKPRRIFNCFLLLLFKWTYVSQVLTWLRKSSSKKYLKETNGCYSFSLFIVAVCLSTPIITFSW